MAKIDIITLSGLTANDGSIIESGATVKFNSEFYAASTDIIIRPMIYRNRELFDMGYSAIPCDEIPRDFIMTVPEEDYYTMTPAILYEMVKDELNNRFGADMYEIQIIA